MRMNLSKGSAFSLVEVTLALGIAAFGLIAVFGLLPTGLNTNQASIRQTAAANVIAGIAADLRQAPTADQIASAPILTAVSPRLGIKLTTSPTKGYLDEGGALTPGSATSLATSSLTTSSNYQVNITIINPVSVPAPTPPVRTVTMAIVQISWPAGASTANAAGSLTTFVALDRN